MGMLVNMPFVETVKVVNGAIKKDARSYGVIRLLLTRLMKLRQDLNIIFGQVDYTISLFGSLYY